MLSIWQNDLDRLVLEWIRHKPNLLDDIMIVVSRWTDGSLFWLAVAGALAIIPRTRKIGVSALLALGLTALLGEAALKPLFARPRPYVDWPELPVLRPKLSAFSFPSGHAAQAMSVAIILKQHLGRKGWWFVSLAVVVGFSRIYLYMHYLTDVLAGFALGLLCGMIVFFLVERYWPEGFLQRKKKSRGE